MSEERASAPPPRLVAALERLARALQRFALYPDGHPALEGLAEETASGLDDALADLGTLDLGVSRRRLLIADGRTDPEHPRLAGLAARLHERRIARVGFRPPVDPDELAEFLRALADPPSRDAAPSRPLEARLQGDRPPAWTTLRGEMRSYAALTLAGEDGEAEEPTADDPGRGERLWEGFARAALREPGTLGRRSATGGDAVEPGGRRGPGATSPDRVARALEEAAGDGDYAQAVTKRFLDVAAEVLSSSRDETGAADRLADRMSELMGLLGGETVRELAQAVEEPERTDLWLFASETLPVGEVVRLLERARERGEIEVSPWTLRLLSRLGRYAALEGDDGTAERAVREQARGLIGPVTAAGPREPAGPFREAIRSLPTIRPDRPLGARARRPDPRRVVEMGLEVGHLGRLGAEAVDAMIEAGRIGELVALADETAGESPAAERIWDRIGAEEALRRLLETGAPDFPALDRMIARIGPRSADALLDALAEAEDRHVRREIFERLADLGSEIVDRLGERLEEDERWYVRRNMLALMVEIGATPDGFRPEKWRTHESVPVRREAYRLLLADPDRRRGAARQAVEEEDPGLVSLGLAALEGEWDPALTEVAARRARDADLPDGTRRTAIRGLRRAGTPAARDALAKLCLCRRPWTFWKRSLAGTGPVVAEAVAALREGWAGDPVAREVLSAAAAAEDPEVRRAATGAEAP